MANSHSNKYKPQGTPRGLCRHNHNDSSRCGCQNRHKHCYFGLLGVALVPATSPKPTARGTQKHKPQQVPGLLPNPKQGQSRKSLTPTSQTKDLQTNTMGGINVCLDHSGFFFQAQARIIRMPALPAEKIGVLAVFPTR